MADLLIGNFEAKRFHVELLCPLEVIEIEFNAHKSHLNSVHKSSDIKLESGARSRSVWGTTQKKKKNPPLSAGEAGIRELPWGPHSEVIERTYGAQTRSY